MNTRMIAWRLANGSVTEVSYRVVLIELLSYLHTIPLLYSCVRHAVSWCKDQGSHRHPFRSSEPSHSAREGFIISSRHRPHKANAAASCASSRISCLSVRVSEFPEWGQIRPKIFPSAQLGNSFVGGAAELDKYEVEGFNG